MAEHTTVGLTVGGSLSSFAIFNIHPSVDAWVFQWEPHQSYCLHEFVQLWKIYEVKQEILQAAQLLSDELPEYRFDFCVLVLKTGLQEFSPANYDLAFDGQAYQLY